MVFLMTFALDVAVSDIKREHSEERDMAHYLLRSSNCHRRALQVCTLIASCLIFPTLALAQSPWERAAANLELSFTGPLARSLALVAIVVGGLMFMYGEAGAKRQISGIVFGGGLALFAAQFLTWLF